MTNHFTIECCLGGHDCLDRPGEASAGLERLGMVLGARVVRVAMCGNDGNTRSAKRPKLGKPWPECGPLTGLTPRLVSVWLGEAA